MKKDKQHNDEFSLKGTFVSVMILGAILVISWIAVFMLFLDRN